MPFASQFALRAITSLVLLAWASFGIAAADSNAPIVISQIYTPGGSGGGQTGYGHSYVELHNRSGAAVSLSGWSVQCGSSGGSLEMTPLTGSIPSGGYYLVVEGNYSGTGNPLPPADATGTTFLTPANGKVAVLATQELLSGCGTALPVIDRVGYGSTGCAEGTPAPGSSPSVALYRLDSGCQDTDQNGLDFQLATASPRNSASPVHYCAIAPTGVGQATPDTVVAGASTLFTVGVIGGRVPPSSGLFVRIDLGPLGGPASQAMYDDGSHGDVAPNDNVFTLRYTTPLGAASNPYALTFTVGDAESRSATDVLHLHILPPIVVSQLYTCGGGGGGALGFNHSYIELHNRGAQAVSLVGWSLQYAPFASGNWSVTPLSGTIQPGQYFLVQGSNSCGGASLPIPDLIGPSFMTPAAGKIVLLAGTYTFTGSCLTALAVVDIVGYGGTDCYEGTAPAPSMTPTLANLRKGDGCRDTNVNGDDFVLTNGTPRNTGSPFATCTQSTGVSAPPPVAFALRGPTPNPAAHELALGFSLANSAPARLALLDVAGRIVATREVGAMGPGAHVVRFADLARLAPGVYLARLSQRGASVTTRIVIAR